MKRGRQGKRGGSRTPRKQRRALYQAHHEERRKRLAISLSRELRARYGRRRITARKGDTVRILSGTFQGREERIAKVDYRHYRFVLDNVTIKKADEKLKMLPIAPAHLMLTKLNLSDPWRKKRLKIPSTEGEGLQTETLAAVNPKRETEESGRVTGAVSGGPMEGV